jgi:hypothetical protein
MQAVHAVAKALWRVGDLQPVYIECGLRLQPAESFGESGKDSISPVLPCLDYCLGNLLPRDIVTMLQWIWRRVSRPPSGIHSLRVRIEQRGR